MVGKGGDDPASFWGYKASMALMLVSGKEFFVGMLVNQGVFF